MLFYRGKVRQFISFLFYHRYFMNARRLLVTCLALIVVSIMMVPASAYFGIMHGSASTVSTLALMGAIAAAFLTMGEEINRQKDNINK
jgi:hypothetical protein